MRFESWSYLVQCTIDDVVLVGDADVSHSVTVSTRLEVRDSMQNGGGGGAIVIEGDLFNHGVITNDQYSFFLHVHGDIENHGTISTPTLELKGVGVVHHLSMGPDAIIEARVFLPEFQAATIVADTPVRFADRLGLGVGTLILEPGSTLELSQWGSMDSGTVMANGNTISVTDNGVLSDLTVDAAVFGDNVVVFGDVLATNGLTVTGTLTGWPYVAADLTVEGLLLNQGSVNDGVHPVRLHILGDLANEGTFANERIVVAGSVAQRIGAGAAGIGVAEFVLESGLQAASYQWYRDGVPLPGATAADLVLPGVGAADYGVYHCEGDGLNSRTVTIEETLPSSDVPGARIAVLEQNRPNPFNPVTEFAFRLDDEARVSLKVYDLAGREVADLVDGVLSAGGHRVQWQPERLPSGTYLYQLRTDGVELSRKCVLQK
jgi:hypothetical protein